MPPNSIIPQGKRSPSSNNTRHSHPTAPLRCAALRIRSSPSANKTSRNSKRKPMVKHSKCEKTPTETDKYTPTRIGRTPQFHGISMSALHRRRACYCAMGWGEGGQAGVLYQRRWMPGAQAGGGGGCAWMPPARVMAPYPRECPLCACAWESRYCVCSNARGCDSRHHALFLYTWLPRPVTARARASFSDWVV
ncbi:hypothetical protein BC567DRAFT_231907 [Phyllosticta citribraziliensis]